MAIKLSLNKTLYSYDGQLEAYVTDTTVVKVQIYTDYNLSDLVLVYKQGDVQDSVTIVDNVAEIPGMNLRSGQLSVAVLYDNTLSNFVQIYITKAAALSQNLVDDDPYFTVDRNKRLVSVPGTQDMLAVNFDENSEVITFKFPRYADGVDLSTKEIYVNYERSDKTRNKALCTLTDISDSYVIFTWVVSAYATQVEGTLNFNIEFRSVDYRWQTQPTSLLVYRSLLYTGEALPDQPELLDQYLAMFAELNSHPPIPGDDGYWRIWSLDTHSYETSEFPLQAGKDGITPTIGDNGNWFLGTTDTGKPSRGATGAPGKDGAGMDITGATVGQIAKITAVDASGVPTAWSPADMPSGGSSDLYVDFWPTGSEQYNGNYNGYQVELATDQTFDAIFDSFKAGNKIVALLYENESKDGSPTSSVDASVTGTKEFGAIHFQFVTANADTGAIAGFPFIGEAIMMIKMGEAAVSYLIENRNVLPTPNADGTDNGKVPIINGTKWELKALPTYANGNEVSY